MGRLNEFVVQLGNHLKEQQRRLDELNTKLALAAEEQKEYIELTEEYEKLSDQWQALAQDVVFAETLEDNNDE